MDISTLVRAERHKITVIGQSSNDFLAKKSYHDQEVPRESKSGSLCPYNSADSNIDRSELDRNDWSESGKLKFVQAMSIHWKNFTMIF
uniref:Uncharacterized protein n=1 Tax=Oryza brachyantha TaxID=4533 RepID=J3NBK5_ORYBR